MSTLDEIVWSLKDWPTRDYVILAMAAVALVASVAALTRRTPVENEDE